MPHGAHEVGEVGGAEPESTKRCCAVGLDATITMSALSAVLRAATACAVSTAAAAAGYPATDSGPSRSITVLSTSAGGAAAVAVAASSAAAAATAAARMSCRGERTCTVWSRTLNRAQDPGAVGETTVRFEVSYLGAGGDEESSALRHLLHTQRRPAGAVDAQVHIVR
jgi:hypothetical protein